MGVKSLPDKTVTRQRRGCDLNPGPTAPESSSLTTRLQSVVVFTLLGVESEILAGHLLSYIRCSKLYTTEAIADDAGMDLFGKIANPRHSLHSLLPRSLVFYHFYVRRLVA